MSNELTKQSITAIIQEMRKGCGSMDTALHETSFNGDHQQLRVLLQDGCNHRHINSKNRLGCTPLRLAASGGHSECVRLLLACGVQVNLCDMKCQSPLAVAVKKKSLECVKMLLDAGAHPDGDRGNMWTPLYLAAMEGSLQVLKALVEGGASMNGIQTPSGEQGTSILYITVAYHHWDCFLHLLTHGGNPDCKAAWCRSFRNNTESLYHSAVAHNVSPIFAQLLFDCGAALGVRNFKGQLPWEMEGDNECLQLIRTFPGQVRSLKSWCRIQVRKCLDRKSLFRISELPLPSKLRGYLQFTEYHCTNVEP